MKRSKKLLVLLLSSALIGSVAEPAIAAETEPAGAGSLVAVGSDGKQYENVDYLSVDTVESFSEVQQANYKELCDEAAELSQNAMDYGSIKLVETAGGVPELRYYLPMKQLSELASAQAAEAVAEMSADPVATGAPFDRLNYFRDQLNSIQQSFFDACLNAAKKNKNKFSINSGTKNLNDLFFAFSTAYDACPEYFEWVDFAGNGFAYKKIPNSKKPYCGLKIPKSKFFSPSLEKEAQSTISQLAKEAKSYASSYYPDDPDYGVARFVDEWLCENNYYEMKGTKPKKFGKKRVYWNCHNSYGCLMEGYGVCESYARAASRILDEAGVTNLFVIGEGGDYSGTGGHAWNYIRLNDSWYLFDATWDDEDYGCSYEFFLIGTNTESSIGSIHNANGAVFYNIPDLDYPTLSRTPYKNDNEDDWPWVNNAA